MNLRKVGCLLLFGIGVADPSRSAAPTPSVPPFLPGARSVLWVGAHPDDEVLAAPLLARWCLDEKLRCTFLVFTSGERGRCLLPGGCLPSLATVRRAEMKRVARSYGARLIHWTLPDGGALADGSAPVWDAARGGHRGLIAAIGREIDAAGADVVLTLDPFHGSTCHADHRAVGSLVSEAVHSARSNATLFFLETRWEVRTSPLTISSRPAAPASAGTFAFDANLPRGTPPRPAWNALIEDASRHPSQFDQEWLRALARVPAARRAIYLAPADLVVSSPEVHTCR